MSQSCEDLQQFSNSAETGLGDTLQCVWHKGSGKATKSDSAQKGDLLKNPSRLSYAEPCRHRSNWTPRVSQKTMGFHGFHHSESDFGFQSHRQAQNSLDVGESCWSYSNKKKRKNNSLLVFAIRFHHFSMSNSSSCAFQIDAKRGGPGCKGNCSAKSTCFFPVRCSHHCCFPTLLVVDTTRHAQWVFEVAWCRCLVILYLRR